MNQSSVIMALIGSQPCLKLRFGHGSDVPDCWFRLDMPATRTVQAAQQFRMWARREACKEAKELWVNVSVYYHFPTIQIQCSTRSTGKIFNISNVRGRLNRRSRYLPRLFVLISLQTHSPLDLLQ